jgi:hypothetical protein
MSKRINFNDVQPSAYDAMEALDKFVDETSIDKLHKEFIKYGLADKWLRLLC